MDIKELKFTVKPSPQDGRDYKASTIYSDFIPPKTVDYRPQMTIVRDQGSQGSCAAMAGAAMKEWQERLDFNYTDYMSPQFIYNLREDVGTDGMYMRDLMKILQKAGVVPESIFPYGNKDRPGLTITSLGEKFRVQRYASIDTVADLKKALVTNGPCVIAVPVYNYGPTMWFKEKGDVFLGGHAMLVVGYDQNGFIIRNSWGKGWQEFGHCYFPLNHWGSQWEVWTTIDESSFAEYSDYTDYLERDPEPDQYMPDPYIPEPGTDPYMPNPYKEKSRIWPVVLGAVVVASAYLYFFVM